MIHLGVLNFINKNEVLKIETFKLMLRKNDPTNASLISTN